MTAKVSFTEMLPGLPPDGSDGTFIGFDNDYNPYILKWRQRVGCWYGTGNDPSPESGRRRDYDGILPLHFLARGTMAGFIIGYSHILIVTDVSSLDTSRSSFGFKDDIA